MMSSVRARLLLVALALSMLALAVSFGAMAYVAATNATRAQEIEQLVYDVQQSRFEATVRSCNSRSQDRRRIAAFVARIAPALERDVHSAFPPVARDCRVYASRSVRVR